MLNGIYTIKELLKSRLFTKQSILNNVKNLYKEVIMHNVDCLSISLKEVDKKIKLFPNQIHFFYIRNNELVGFIRAFKYSYNKRNNQLINPTIIVSPAYQNNCIGIRLMQILLTFINNSKIYDTLEIETLYQNINLYQKLGFKLMWCIKNGLKYNNSNKYMELYKMIYEK